MISIIKISPSKYPNEIYHKVFSLYRATKFWFHVVLTIPLLGKAIRLTGFNK